VGRKNIVVVQCAGQKAGLVVDVLLGEYQTVIKPLSSIFSKLSGISGSTILGSGDVAMILDVPALMAQAGELVSE
jgi:two-component system chemotaxis sensor kinase CheA